MPIIEADDGQNIGDLARQLVAIADAEGLPQPLTETSGPTIRFVVTDELLASYKGAPAKKAEDEDEPEKSGEGDEASGKSRRGRKSKGSK